MKFNRFSYIFTVVLLLVGSSSLVRSQDKEDDFGVWALISAKKSVIQGLDFKTSWELRFRNDASDLGLFLFTSGFSYSSNKYFSVEAAYVLMGNNYHDGTYGLRNRFYVAGTGKLYAGDFVFSLREMLEETFYSDKDLSYDNFNPQNVIRSLFMIEFKNPSSFDPYISAEPFCLLFNPKHYVLDKIRYTAGVKISVGQRSNIGFYYRYSQRFNNAVSPNKNIFGLQYDVSF